MRDRATTWQTGVRIAVVLLLARMVALGHCVVLSPPMLSLMRERLASEGGS